MRTMLSGLLLALLLVLPGCGEDRGGEGTWEVYFLTQTEGAVQALEAEERTLAQGTDPVEGLLDCLLEGPLREDLVRTIPQGVEVRDWSLKNGLLTVDFSSRYGSLSGVGLTLADYSVVLTLCQLPEVETVMILSDGDLIPYRDHQRLTPEDIQGIPVE